MHSQTGLVVVVVAYGDPQGLEGALGALGDAYPVIVVDNSSSPATAAVAARHHASYLDPGQNLGFAAGVNRALAEAPEQADVLLLNPDAAIRPNAVAALSEVLANDPSLAAVAPQLLHPDTGLFERAGWPFPSPARAWLSAIGLDRCFWRADFLTGAVLLLRRRALDELGGFDERFFLYAEEVDWQFRARQAGWSSLCVTGAVAQHLGGATSSDDYRREVLFSSSYERYIRKWYGLSGWWLCRMATILGSAWRSVVLTPPRRNHARLRLRIFLSGPETLRAVEHH